MNPFTLVPPRGVRAPPAGARRSPRRSSHAGPLPGRLGAVAADRATEVAVTDDAANRAGPRGPAGAAVVRVARSAQEEAGADRVGRVEREGMAPGQVGAALHLRVDRGPPADRWTVPTTRPVNAESTMLRWRSASPTRRRPCGVEAGEARGGAAPARRAVHLAIREDRHVALGQRRIDRRPRVGSSCHQMIP